MRKDIIPVQFLRGLAASLVLLSHFADRLIRRDLLPGGEENWTIPIGHLGVMMFFSISGFIMVYTTRNEFEARAGAKQFLVRRLVRVAPLYYATTIAMILFQYLTAPYSTNDGFALPGIRQWVSAILFIPDLNYQGIIQPVYGVGWSLNFEIMFYVVFACGIRLGRTGGMIAIISALCLLSLVGPFIPFPEKDAPQIAVIAHFYTQPDLLFFVGGMAIALLLGRIGTIRIGLNQMLLCLIAGLCLCVGLFLPDRWAMIAVVGTLCIGTLFTCPDEPSSSFTSFARLFGDVSYSMYLTHSFMLGFLALLVARYVPINPVTLMLSMLCAVLLCFVAGWTSWRIFELPVTAWLQRRFNPGRGKSVALA